MKKYLLFTVSLFTAVTSYAQKDVSHNLGLSLGTSLPLGNFGKNTVDNDTAISDEGFAKTGWVFSVFYQHSLIRHLEFYAIAGLTGNAIDNDKKRIELEPKDPSVTLDYVRSKGWFAQSLQIGMQGSFLLNKNGNSPLSLTGRVTTGIQHMVLPETKYHYSFIQGFVVDEGSSTRKAKHSYAVPYTLGLGLTFLHFSGLEFSAGIDYSAANFLFKDVRFENSTTKKTHDIRMKYEVLLVRVGVSYEFY